MAKKGTSALALRLQQCEAKFEQARGLEDRGHTALHRVLYVVYQVEKDIRANPELEVDLKEILKRKAIRRSKNRARSLIAVCYSPVLPRLGTPERKTVINRMNEYSKRINDALITDPDMDIDTFLEFQRSWRKSVKNDSAQLGSDNDNAQLDGDQDEQSEWIRGTGTWIGFPNTKIYRQFREALRDPAFHHVDLRICVLKGRAVIMRVHAPRPTAELHPFPRARYLRQQI